MIDVGIAGSIITHGLGRPACRGIIINFPFGLACHILPPIPPGQGITGGSIPLKPGEIQAFYQPVDPSFIEGTLVDPKVWNKKKVRIRVTSANLNMEKEYLIPIEKVKTLVKVYNIINSTKQNMSIVVNNLRKITTDAVVRIKNLRKTYWS